MSEPLRIGVIGVGAMGGAHAKCLAEGKIKKADLTALCENDPARLAELKSLFPDIPCFSNAADLFAAHLCDAVIIATPHYFHPTIGIEAFHHGLHVLSEKPVAVQTGAARALIRAADESGKCFAVMFNQRTDPLFQKTRELVQNGKLGRPKRMSWTVTNWYRTQKYYDSGVWRATWDGEGGGVLMNQAPHQLDLWQWIFGMPKRLRAFCAIGKYHQIEVEDEATIYAEYENGATALFHTTTGEYPGTNRLELAGDRGKLVLEEGKLRLWRLKESERDFCVRSEESFARIPMEYEEMRFLPCKDAHARVLQSFVDHIREGTPLIADGREGLGALAIANAAYLSAWTDDWVTLPTDEVAFDAELAARRASSNPHSGRAQSETGGYQERWQVRW